MTAHLSRRKLTDAQIAEIRQLAAEGCCLECGHVFAAIVPEPPEEYRGDGTFAENH